MPGAREDFREDPPTTMHVRQAIAGDQESLAWLVRRLTPLLLAQATYRIPPRLRSVCDPHDLVQEAWLTLLPRLGDLRERDGRQTPVLLRFLTTALLNKLNNLVKRRLRAAADDEVPSDFAADASGVVTAVVRRETRDRVLAAIEALEERDREILLLRGIEQQRGTTVAMLLGLTPQAVAMRYTRALARLRVELPGSVFDELDSGSGTHQ